MFAVLKNISFVGVVCSYIIKVFRNYPRLVWKIPKSYILPRLAKKIRCGIAKETMHVVETGVRLEKTTRLTRYYNTFVGTIS